MTNKAKVIQEIVTRIQEIPEEKLTDILRFIEKIEHMTRQKALILSFAGKWKDVDDSVTEDFTDHLHENRNNDIRPIA